MPNEKALGLLQRPANQIGNADSSSMFFTDLPLVSISKTVRKLMQIFKRIGPQARQNPIGKQGEGNNWQKERPEKAQQAKRTNPRRDIPAERRYGQRSQYSAEAGFCCLENANALAATYCICKNGPRCFWIEMMEGREDGPKAIQLNRNLARINGERVILHFSFGSVARKCFLIWVFIGQQHFDWKSLSRCKLFPQAKPGAASA